MNFMLRNTEEGRMWGERKKKEMKIGKPLSSHKCK
jgi:hypothetical protein